ncbi:ThuA domain-containing protein [Gayadomonas joobiniege]|uniref:ThuA domain-containing protein n=1 Tax=Gayadomonas joobiniege TaxID=1234606 RepID=UPI000377FA75|nr:ThuA domain-containing protein [Gayadomonas joobiniege]
MHIRKLSFFVVSALLTGCATAESDQHSEQKLRALIIDGQNNHVVWPKSTMMMKQYLEETDKFDVDVYRAKYVWKFARWGKSYPLNDGKSYTPVESPKADPDFAPEFAKYDVVISNFGWKAAGWPETTKRAFEHYMENGGGFVTVHAANNSYPEWPAYNKMIGLGGWGGRNHNSGPWVYYKNDELVRDTSKGAGGGHGKQHEFVIRHRVTDHPITKGLPTEWMHSKDELYNRLRGPAENMTVLATAYDDKKHNGYGRHEPVLMTINYGEGRIFHTTLGHDQAAFSGVGFITTFTRGAEWAASGKVTIEKPEDFPTATESRSRAFN